MWLKYLRGILQHPIIKSGILSTIEALRLSYHWKQIVLTEWAIAAIVYDNSCVHLAIDQMLQETQSREYSGNIEQKYSLGRQLHAHNWLLSLNFAPATGEGAES